MSVDLQQESREADSLPMEVLASYLQAELPEFMENGRLDVKQFSAGASNLTYQLSNGDTHLILRRPPVGTKAKKAHDMAREYWVLDCVSELFPLAPNPHLLCEDESILGAKFFIMEEIVGLGINKELPAPMSESQQWVLCQEFVENLVALHQLDISKAPLSSLGKPEGYITRQIEGWQQRYEKSKTADAPCNDSIYRWLQSHLVSRAPPSLIHNDYKFDNFIVDPDETQKIVGVLDWEMSTLGDPFMDLGCSLAYWIERDDSAELQAIRMMPTHLSGMMRRQEIFDAYCELRNLNDIDFKPYYVFGLFRLAVIVQQIYYRFYHGQSDNPKFKKFGQLVSILIETAKQQIDH